MNFRQNKICFLFFWLFILCPVLEVSYAVENTNHNEHFKSVLSLKNSISKKNSITGLKPFRSVEGIKDAGKLGAVRVPEVIKVSLKEKNASEKREKPLYLRYLLPVAITIGAGTATYLLYSVRSN